MRWFLIGAVTIVAFDTLGALAARAFTFEYAGNPVGIAISTAISGGPAFVAAREAGSVRIGVAVGAGIALVDATIGWAASWVIGPGAPQDVAGMTPELFIASLVLTILIVVGLGAVTGLIAGLLAARVRRNPARQGAPGDRHPADR